MLSSYPTSSLATPFAAPAKNRVGNGVCPYFSVFCPLDAYIGVRVGCWRGPLVVQRVSGSGRIGRSELGEPARSQLDVAVAQTGSSFEAPRYTALLICCTDMALSLRGLYSCHFDGHSSNSDDFIAKGSVTQAAWARCSASLHELDGRWIPARSAQFCRPDFTVDSAKRWYCAWRTLA